MCGICGVFEYGSGSPVDPSEIDRMTDQLVHRGPDGRGTYINGPIGLGHRRLSIIDLGDGQQPMCNEDGSIWVSFNGEIYNHEEIRGSLTAKGHRFKTRCDTEVIVHLYEEFGDEFVTI